MELKWKNSTAVESDWPGTDTDVASVPGGWIVRSVCVGVSGIPSVMAMVFVPDPPVMAELGTFDPPADDRPPMTDDALEAWLTETYGEPGYKDRDVMTWPEVFQRPHFDSPSAVTMELLGGGKYWHFNDGQQWLPAHVAGPALWAAHRYGNP